MPSFAKSFGRFLLLAAVATVLLAGCGPSPAPAAAPTPLPTATIAAPAAASPTAAATAPAPTAAASATPSPQPTGPTAVVPTATPTETPKPTATPGPSPTPVTVPTSTTVIVLKLAQNPQLGSILTDAQGMTLYTYKNDAPDKSNCTGGCATLWPPLTIGFDVTPGAGPGVSGNIGVLERSDGTYQVWYNDAPLYRYSKDSQPGDTNGNGLNGLWSVVAVAAQTPAAQTPTPQTAAPAATAAAPGTSTATP